MGYITSRSPIVIGGAEARHLLASYWSRQGGVFAFSDELADKRRQLAEVEKELAADTEEKARAVAA